MRLFVKKTLLITTALLASLVSANTSFASSTACKAPNSATPSLGTLVVAGQLAQLPSVQWGVDQGCYAQFGLQVKAVAVSTSQIALAGVVGGSYDLAITTPVNLIQAKVNGNIDGIFVAPRHGYTALQLARAQTPPLYPGYLILQTGLIVKTNSSIKSWSDLSGKKIAIQSFQSADQAGTILALRSRGVDTSKVQFLTMPSSQMGAALDAGSVDAVVANEPFATQIIQNGGTLIGYPNSFFQKAGVAVVYASVRSVVQNKSSAMRAFQKATLFINHLLNQTSNQDSYRKTISSVTGVSAEVANATQLPTMIERNVSTSDLYYIVDNLKKVGFMPVGPNLQAMLFK